MTASVGRIVHYTPEGDEGACFAAIVTAMNGDGTVALDTFYPPRGNHVPPDALEAVQEWRPGGPRGGRWHEPEHVPGSRPPRY